MCDDEGSVVIKITGYEFSIHRNDDDDVVIRQPNPFEDDSVIIVGKQQVSVLISALQDLPSILE